MEIVKIEGKELRRLQLIQLDMLTEFDALCRRRGIPYTIFGGTLLGAVRHGGYIPWDDDADIAMLRDDYERFKSFASELDESICYFQDHDTDAEYRWGYGKLRRTGTTFVRAGQEHFSCQTGVFVDVFPMDAVPRSLAGQAFVDLQFFFLRKILWSAVGKISPSATPVERAVYRLLSKISPNIVFARLNKWIAKHRCSEALRVRTLLFPSTGKLYIKNPLRERYSMPKEWFTDLSEYEFEGHKLMGVRDYDRVLTYIYGDYMKLPPESERAAHAPVSSYDFAGFHE